MWIRIIDYVLAAAGVVGHLVLLMVLVRRRLLSRLPVFAILIVFYLVRSGLLLLPHFARSWPAFYWVLVYLDPGLQLLVVASLGVIAWRVRDTRRAGLVVAIPVFVFLSALVAWYIGPSSHFSPLNLLIKLSMFVSALWLLAAAGLLVLLHQSDARTRILPLSIALGFAAYSAANIVTEIVHMHFALVRQPALYTSLAYFRVIVYLCCLAGWSVVFMRDSSQAA